MLAESRRAVERAARALLDRQHPDGYWLADLTADTTLESDYILLQLWLHPPVDGEWRPHTRTLVEKAVAGDSRGASCPTAGSIFIRRVRRTSAPP